MSVESAEPITEHDLFVGAVLVIHQRTFEMLEGDEFTMQVGFRVLLSPVWTPHAMTVTPSLKVLILVILEPSTHNTF